MRQYVAIDLKSFYASVECVERGLDPLRTNLVVADESRTDKTICLAVSPSLKAYGISGRARLFEVVQRVRGINYERRSRNGFRPFTGKSAQAVELSEHPDWELDYIVAPPRMRHYLDFSTRIYNIYLRYISVDDIHVYSVDEVMMDVTNYLSMYKISAHELAKRMVHDVFVETGITATVGIGTNLYLCKVAMDIMAKHSQPDSDGVRIAELDEQSYRRQLWNHRPLTDFWRMGHGITQKLGLLGVNTMGRLARLSLDNEELLYRLFGVNAELIIDHAWGWEPCTIEAIKGYRPETNSISSGQVLNEPYTVEKARVVVQEMADAMALKLVDKRLMCDQLVLTIGYDVINLTDSNLKKYYQGDITTDHYGRQVPRHSHGTQNLESPTSSVGQILEATSSLFDRIVNPQLLIRRLNLTANHVVRESGSQLDLFTDYDALAKERRLQEARLSIRAKFGKNAILRGLNFAEGATARERNQQIGGHKA